MLYFFMKLAVILQENAKQYIPEDHPIIPEIIPDSFYHLLFQKLFYLCLQLQSLLLARIEASYVTPLFILADDVPSCKLMTNSVKSNFAHILI